MISKKPKPKLDYEVILYPVMFFIISLAAGSLPLLIATIIKYME